MYRTPDPDERRAKTSTDNAREIVDALDDLICRRITTHRSLWEKDEVAEVIKRRLTDYLLVTDPRAGVFVEQVYGKT